MRQWVADIIRQREVAAIPVMTHPGIEQNGHTVRQAVSDGNIHYQAVITLAQQFPSAAACTIMDLTTEAEAFGAEIAFSDSLAQQELNRRTDWDIAYAPNGLMRTNSSASSGSQAARQPGAL